MYYFIFGYTESLFLHTGFLKLRRAGVTLRCGAWSLASEHGLQGARASASVALELQSHGSQALEHRQDSIVIAHRLHSSANHGTTREILNCFEWALPALLQLPHPLILTFPSPYHLSFQTQLRCLLLQVALQKMGNIWRKSLYCIDYSKAVPSTEQTFSICFLNKLMDWWIAVMNLPTRPSPGAKDSHLCFSGPSALHADVAPVVFLSASDSQKHTPLPREVSLLGVCI